MLVDIAFFCLLQGNKGFRLISPLMNTRFLAGPCFYCGGPLNPTGTGLDRKTPSKGYVLGNVVSCCGKCNEAKNSLSQAEFAEWVAKVYEHFAKKAMATDPGNQAAES